VSLKDEFLSQLSGDTEERLAEAEALLERAIPFIEQFYKISVYGEGALRLVESIKRFLKIDHTGKKY